MMFGLLAAFGFLAVALTNMHTVLGEGFYWSLDLPWRDDLLADQALGGTAVWAVGELPALVLLMVTAIQWAKSDERAATHADENPDAETDLAAYNAMLTQLDRRTPK
jgi:putative copper resistance protein D